MSARFRLVVLGLALCMGFLSHAPRDRAQAAPDPEGVVEVTVDLTDPQEQRTRLEFPVRPGPLTLCFPEWIPGEHSPSGPVCDMAGLVITAGGKPVRWNRDERDLYSFHCTVPAGANRLDASFQMLSNPRGFVNAAPSSSKVTVLNWNQVLLYEKGRSVREVQYRARVTVPPGWKIGTALPIESTEGGVTTFKPVTLETLVDSPVLCGRHFRSLQIGSSGDHSVEMACDSERGLEVPASVAHGFGRLVTEAQALFGVRHYRSYRFLLSLSDHILPAGLEHHECSDNRLPELFFSDANARLVYTWIMPHEYVHSWCGKYRRPDGLVRSDFRRPQATRLLWVYEGLTQYLAIVLAARSGLWTTAETRDWLAVSAEGMKHNTGRAWRSLEDTAVSARLLYPEQPGWASWRRGIDFYDEGALIWLEVDTIIRRTTGNKKSLDDFCKRFFAGPGDQPAVKPFSLDNLVDDLRAVAPYEWKRHLERRVGTVGDPAPLTGLHDSGWTLVYKGSPSDLHAAANDLAKQIDLRSSVGLLLTREGVLMDVLRGSAAGKAGLAPGMKLLAVNGRRWNAPRLESAVTQSAEGGKLELLCESGDFFATHVLAYTGGAKYVSLERRAGTGDLLSNILKPIATDK